jgi:hypothetical protein
MGKLALWHRQGTRPIPGTGWDDRSPSVFPVLFVVHSPSALQKIQPPRKLSGSAA